MAVIHSDRLFLDFNYWSGLLGMEQFKKDFGVWDTATESWIIPSSWQSIATGTPHAGLAVGCLLAGLFGNYYGRVKSISIAAVIALIGILIQASSIRSYWQIMVGRIINSISMGVICKCAKSHITNIL
ncbi:general substrate transporter [Aspergillus keveii]|uniref:General substrate transporter n=1 Tax=Aspergillus keveii TaxID=714993 RepID=A0ABR4FHD7_9EURO